MACQPLNPRESRVRTFCSGKGQRRTSSLRNAVRFLLHLHPLVTKQVDASTPMLPAAPVTPEQGSHPNFEGVQQHAHLERLRSSAALPLALLPQRTRTTTADAGSIHDAQAPVSFSVVLVWDQLLVGRALKRPIRLESKILTREATSFPG